MQVLTVFYVSTLPKVACALLLSGENLDNFGDVKNILVEMGTYFQVQVNLFLWKRKVLVYIYSLRPKISIADFSTNLY